MWFQWNEQREYMDLSWGCGQVSMIFRLVGTITSIIVKIISQLQFLATIFVLLNLFGQLGGVVMVLGRLKVDIACGILFFIVVLQVKMFYNNYHLYFVD